MLPLGWMAHGFAAINPVAVTPADSLACYVASLDEVVGDALRSTVGDAHRLRDIAQSCIRVALDAEEYLRVIRQEVPAIRFVT